MPLIQRAEITDRLRRRTGIRGGRTVFDLDYTIVPVIIVDDAREGAGETFSERWFSGSFGAAAGVGNSSKVGAFNPVDSGTEVYLDSFWGFINGTTLGDVTVAYRDSTLGTPTPAATRFLNSRFGGGAAAISGPVTQLSGQNSAGTVPFPFMYVQVGVGGGYSSVWHPLGVTLAPGRGIEINTIALNATFLVTFRGIERALPAVPTP